MHGASTSLLAAAVASCSLHACVVLYTAPTAVMHLNKKTNTKFNNLFHFLQFRTEFQNIHCNKNIESL